MALVFNQEYLNTCKIGSKEIKFKPWTTKNEKDYLIAVESDEDITDQKIYDMLIRPCLQDPDVVLTTDEQKKLMIEVRKKSIGSTFSMTFTCKKCKKVNEVQVDFDSITKFKSSEWGTSEINLGNDIIKINFNNPLSKNIFRRLDEVHSVVEKNFVEFLIHIRSIEINDNLEDTFTFEELKTFIEELPSASFDKIFKDYKNMKSSLEFEYNPYCMMCGEENNINFEYIPNFLWA
jgi:hypothetical protein